MGWVGVYDLGTWVPLSSHVPSLLIGVHCTTESATIAESFVGSILVLFDLLYTVSWSSCGAFSYDPLHFRNHCLKGGTLGTIWENV